MNPLQHHDELAATAAEIEGSRRPVRSYLSALAKAGVDLPAKQLAMFTEYMTRCDEMAARVAGMQARERARTIHALDELFSER